MNKIIIYTIIGILLLVGIAGAALTVNRSIKVSEGIYTLEIKGKANSGFLGTGFWIDKVSYSAEKEGFIELSIEPLLIFGTRDITIEGKLYDKNGAKVGTSSIGIGGLATDTGETKDFNFNFKGLMTDNQPYKLKLYMYEAGDGIFASRTLKATKDISGINLD